MKNINTEVLPMLLPRIVAILLNALSEEGQD
jgi:hypothetical protein